MVPFLQINKMYDGHISANCTHSLLNGFEAVAGISSIFLHPNWSFFLSHLTDWVLSSPTQSHQLCCKPLCTAEGTFQVFSKVFVPPSPSPRHHSRLSQCLYSVGLMWGHHADNHSGQPVAEEVRIKARLWCEWWWRGVNLKTQLPWR